MSRNRVGIGSSEKPNSAPYELRVWLFTTANGAHGANADRANDAIVHQRGSQSWSKGHSISRLRRGHKFQRGSSETPPSSNGSRRAVSPDACLLALGRCEGFDVARLCHLVRKLCPALAETLRTEGRSPSWDAHGVDPAHRAAASVMLASLTR
jgi:hypothetical protein